MLSGLIILLGAVHELNPLAPHVDGARTKQQPLIIYVGADKNTEQKCELA